MSTISDSLGLNVTVFSHTDRLEIGLVADRGSVVDAPGLAAAFGEELDLLKQSMRGTERLRGADEVKRLSSVDAQFLAMEDRRVHSHVCQLTIIEVGQATAARSMVGVSVICSPNASI